MSTLKYFQKQIWPDILLHVLTIVYINVSPIIHVKDAVYICMHGPLITFKVCCRIAYGFIDQNLSEGTSICEQFLLQVLTTFNINESPIIHVKDAVYIYRHGPFITFKVCCMFA